MSFVTKWMKKELVFSVCKLIITHKNYLSASKNHQAAITTPKISALLVMLHSPINLGDVSLKDVSTSNKMVAINVSIPSP
jgi:hypothetical protein